MDITNETQRNRAIIEDEIVDLMLKYYSGFVMHGGTAVWRCYGGNRFSRDVDFYSNLRPSDESRFQKQFHKLLIEKGYPIREEKYNNKTKTMHVIFKGGSTTGKLDITFENAKGIAAEYLRVDGSKRIILALSPEALLNEKIDAYLDKYSVQSHEIQDLYDMLILKDRISKLSINTRNKLSSFLTKIKADPPRDEKELKKLILNGVAPSFNDILRIFEGWLDNIDK
ncbi:nucleotidyl transferase AbiEii/AbiGii toxin family protein [Candidatus Marsarchaeota archaeon]|jgi:predicted nucleotidyltransferase component of viral defense system|nr:nucleotidyl transferase AbiEii/AbiGii toxin family protein [Candidatus Marsarchaeota archaeon]MCL5092504.1 nucleotidyl transferase AbiEii/AbiGii toxin family protein [Candidatus Marsarchaeota archaeon]